MNWPYTPHFTTFLVSTVISVPVFLFKIAPRIATLIPGNTTHQASSPSRRELAITLSAAVIYGIGCTLMDILVVGKPTLYPVGMLRLLGTSLIGLTVMVVIGGKLLATYFRINHLLAGKISGSITMIFFLLHAATILLLPFIVSDVQALYYFPTLFD